MGRTLKHRPAHGPPRHLSCFNAPGKRRHSRTEERRPNLQKPMRHGVSWCLSSCWCRSRSDTNRGGGQCGSPWVDRVPHLMRGRWGQDSRRRDGRQAPFPRRKRRNDGAALPRMTTRLRRNDGRWRGMTTAHLLPVLGVSEFRSPSSASSQTPRLPAAKAKATAWRLCGLCVLYVEINSRQAAQVGETHGIYA